MPFTRHQPVPGARPPLDDGAPEPVALLVEPAAGGAPTRVHVPAIGVAISVFGGAGALGQVVAAIITALADGAPGLG